MFLDEASDRWRESAKPHRQVRSVLERQDGILVKSLDLHRRGRGPIDTWKVERSPSVDGFRVRHEHVDEHGVISTSVVYDQAASPELAAAALIERQLERERARAVTVEDAAEPGGDERAPR